MGRGHRRLVRFGPWLARAVACGGLVWLLVVMAEYIWAPLPPGYPPGEMPEGQGEGMMFLFFFVPCLAVLVGLLAPPIAKLLRWLRSRGGQLG